MQSNREKSNKNHLYSQKNTQAIPATAMDPIEHNCSPLASHECNVTVAL